MRQVGNNKPGVFDGCVIAVCDCIAWIKMTMTFVLLMETSRNSLVMASWDTQQSLWATKVAVGLLNRIISIIVKVLICLVYFTFA